MTLNISRYQTLNEFFGDVVEVMNNDFLRILLTKGYEIPLIQLDEMLALLKKHTNVNELIKEFKTKYLTDINRFDSLISEIRAGCFLLIHEYPVQFINVGKGKTPDIESKVQGRRAFVEVKRITKKEFNEGSINYELASRKLPFDLDIHVQRKFYKASDVVEELINKLSPPEQITEEFIEYKFSYGEFSIRKPKGKPIYVPMISDVVPPEKSSIYDHDDAYISREQLNATIISDLEDGINQLTSYVKEDDLCFVLLDNHDILNYSIDELEDLLYCGREIIISIQKGNKIEFPYQVIQKAKESKKLGWNLLLADILYDPPRLDYSTNKGWFDYSPEAQHLNGVFYLEGGDFIYQHSTCMLNPFVENSRNYPTLEKMKYYKRRK
jgi:hypothetical protein